MQATLHARLEILNYAAGLVLLTCIGLLHWLRQQRRQRRWQELLA
jgi:hypothetical protein